MTVKQNQGTYTSDGAKYGTPTNGLNTLETVKIFSTGTTKQNKGSQAPDGSIYFTLTDGSGNLV